MKKSCLMWMPVALAGLVSLALAGVAHADVYPLNTCPVTGQILGKMGPAVVKTYDGREVRFCCGACPAKFEANPAEYTAKIDAALIKEQADNYPLQTCLVSGEKLGEMSPPIDYVYQNKLVRLCCKGCIKKLEAAPEKYLPKLNAAVVEQQKATYPLDTCIVSGEKLGGAMGEAVDYVVGGQLVRFCCKGCVKKFEQDPAKYLSKLSGQEQATGKMPAMKMKMDHGAMAHQH